MRQAHIISSLQTINNRVHYLYIIFQGFFFLLPPIMHPIQVINIIILLLTTSTSAAPTLITMSHHPCLFRTVSESAAMKFSIWPIATAVAPTFSEMAYYADGDKSQHGEDPGSASRSTIQGIGNNWQQWEDKSVTTTFTVNRPHLWRWIWR